MNLRPTMPYLVVLCTIVATNVVALAQPVISSLSSYSGVPGTSLTISGSGFNATVDSNIVYFGATRGTVTSATASSLTVTLPAGATNAPVTVTNTGTGLSGQSGASFLPTFSAGGSYTPEFNFNGYVDITASYRPERMLIKDMDGDGHPDMIVGYTGFDRISVFRNRGGADASIHLNSLESGVDLVGPLWATIVDIEVADIDRDGKQDILFLYDGQIVIYKNTAVSGVIGSGSFAPPVSISTLDGAVGMACNDIDSDGKPDLAIRASNSISLYRNVSSSGTINASSFDAPFVIESLPASSSLNIDLFDVDGDGKCDLLYNEYSYLVISRNIGSTGVLDGSSFAAGTSFDFAGFRSAEFVDMDGDGKPDIVGINENNQLAVARNAATPGSIPSASLSSVAYAPLYPIGFAIADMNGDSKPDIVYGSYMNETEVMSSIGVMLNTAVPGSITTSSFSATRFFYGGTVAIFYPTGISGVAVGDMNSDGRPDILNANGGGSIQIIQTLPPAVSVTSLSSYQGYPGSSITINGANFSMSPSHNVVRFGAVAATVTSASATTLTVTVPTGACYAPVQVYNSDLDLAGSSSKAFTPTYDNSSFPAGAISFDGQVNVSLPGSESAGTHAIADLDGDGKPDMVVCRSGAVSVLRNISTAGTITNSSFATPVNFSVPEAWFIRIGDMDGDGKQDIVVVGNKLYVLLNACSPGSISSVSFGSPVTLSKHRSGDVVLCDLDVDGKTDILFASSPFESFLEGVVISHNLSSPGHINDSTFNYPQLFKGDYSSFSNSVTLSDLNNDLRPDIVYGDDYFAHALRVLRNISQPGVIGSVYNGYGYSAEKNSFTLDDGIDFGSGHGSFILATGDMDGDGKPDIVGVNPNKDSLFVIRNTTSGSATTFASPVYFPKAVTDANHPGLLALGDVDGDGKLDVVLGSSNSYRIGVYRNIATVGDFISSSLAQPVYFTANTNPIEIKVSDLDGDHRPDISFTGEMAAVGILRNDPVAITGVSMICTATPVTLGNSVSGGTWSSSNAAVATINSAGVTTGVAAGTSTISYSFPGGGQATKVVTVFITQVISGPTALCVGNAVTVSSGSGLGDWATSNDNIYIDGLNGFTGRVTPLAAGTALISYTLYETGCVSTVTVTVTAVPAAIAGSSTVSAGSTITLSNSTSGGTWSTATSAVATVGTSGIVNGVSAGTTIISYVVGGCVTTKIVTVTAAGATISGIASVCAGATTTLGSTAFGGTWTSANTAVATVGASSGIVTGVTGGTATISYVQGSSVATVVVTVNALPDAGIVSGPDSLCESFSGALFTATGLGGVWRWSNNYPATLDSVTGVLNSYSYTHSRTDITVTYKVANGCGIDSAVKAVAIIPYPDTVAITGPAEICSGASAAFAIGSTGGRWEIYSPEEGPTASIDSITGIMTAGAAGDLYVVYSWNAAFCPAGAVKEVTITPLPEVHIDGVETVAIGGTIELVCAPFVGTWSADDVHVSIDAAGIVTGISAGTGTVSYVVTHSCGTTVATKNITVELDGIAGELSVCVGSASSLGNTTSGGVWSGSNSAVVSVGSASGVITGVAAGTAIITYTAAGLTTSAEVTVNALPYAGVISGVDSVCQENYVTFTNPVSGGSWSWRGDLPIAPGLHMPEEPGEIAHVPAIDEETGQFTGGSPSIITPTVITIVYTVSNGCAVDSATKSVTIMPGAIHLPITGPDLLCVGETATVAYAGGTPGYWTTPHPHLISVDSFSGAVTAVSAGFGDGWALVQVAWIHNDWDGYCPSMWHAKWVHITDGPPAAATITGPTSVVEGATVTLTANQTGGIWSLSNLNAIIDSTGTPVDSAISTVLTGVAAGAVTVSYTRTNGCGSGTATYPVVVNLPPILGPTSITGAGTITLTHATPGGTWSTTCNDIAVVNSDGEVTGVTSGLATITYTVGSSYTTTVITVDMTSSAITGINTVCAGATTTLSHPVSGGVWSTANTAVATAAIGGAITGVEAGTTTITYAYASGCSSLSTATVNALPAAITGNSAVCIGRTRTMSNAVAGGTWSSSNTAVGTVGAATGIVRGVAAGSTIISYVLGTGCFATKTITVNPNPPLGYSTIPSVCVGTTTTFSNPMPGGVWASSEPSKATIDSFSGVANGLTTGTTFIAYTHLATGCFVALDVNVTPAAEATAGSSTVCTGSTTTLTNATAFGTWSSLNTSVATVGSSTGIVTGVAPGTVVIRYNRYCGADKVVTVEPAGSAGTISGASAVTAGSSITLSSSVSGGTWSSSSSNATVSSAGVVTGVTAGSATVSYAVSNSCGTAVSTKEITITGSSVDGITGALTLCSGHTTVLSNATPSGSWSSNNPTVATVTADGEVAGLSPGIANITYTAAAGYTVAQVTVNAQPAVITGTANVCEGAITTLYSATTGGSWSSSSSNATINTTGIVTGVAAGTATISYTGTNGCARAAMVTVLGQPVISGAAVTCAGSTTTLAASVAGTWSGGSATVATVGSTGIVTGIAAGTARITYNAGACRTTQVVTVNAAPASITGTLKACPGTTTTLASTTAGGTWSSSDGATATVAGGVVTGVAAGTAVISYTAGAGCSRTAVVTINATPASLTGTTTVCPGSTTTLTNGTAAASWGTSSTAVATVAGGVVTGVAAGTATITYTATGTGCKTTTTVTVNSAPAVIGGPATVCPGATVALTNTVAGGTWTSSNGAIASVNATTGIVTGVTGGAATITYTTGAGCYRTKAVTVSGSAAAITGYTTVCEGRTTALNTWGSGVWSSSNTGVATVVSPGTVTGVSAGTATISFTISATGCVATTVVTVIAMPPASTGTTTICSGQTTTLANATAGGSWVSANPAVASVGSATGIVTGVGTAGTVTISYKFGNGCAVNTPVTIRPLPAVIGGTYSVCATAATTLTSTTSGGTWSSSNTAVATVGTGLTAGHGVVSGLSAGTTTISYTLTTTGCARTAVVTVDACSRPASPATEAMTMADLQLYPNPTTGAFTVVSQEAGMLTVYSMEGKQVTGYSIAAGINQLALPQHLTSGIYMCRYTGASGNTTMVRLVYER